MDGKRTSKSLSLVKDLTKGDAKDLLADLIKRPILRFSVPSLKANISISTGGSGNQHGRKQQTAHPRQIFEMAIAGGHLRLNPAALLFTPKSAKRPKHSVMTIENVVAVFEALGIRDRLSVKLAPLAGMRPRAIFALTWGRVGETYAEVQQRVYRGLVDTPKTHYLERQAALTDGLLADLDLWRLPIAGGRPEAFVFPSEVGRPSARKMSGAGTCCRSLKPSVLAGAIFR